MEKLKWGFYGPTHQAKTTKHKLSYDDPGITIKMIPAFYGMKVNFSERTVGYWSLEKIITNIFFSKKMYSGGMCT